MGGRKTFPCMVCTSSKDTVSITNNNLNQVRIEMRPLLFVLLLYVAVVVLIPKSWLPSNLGILMSFESCFSFTTSPSHVLLPDHCLTSLLGLTIALLVVSPLLLLLIWVTLRIGYFAINYQIHKRAFSGIPAISDPLLSIKGYYLSSFPLISLSLLTFLSPPFCV